MRKVFLAVMAIAAIALTGCKEKNNPTPSPEPTPTPTPTPVENTVRVLYLSDCMADNVVFTYTDNNGATQTLKKENWVAFDKNNSVDKAFFEEYDFLFLGDEEAQNKAFEHVKKFTLQLKPETPSLIKLEKADNAILPEDGTIIVYGYAEYGSAGNSHFSCKSMSFERGQDLTDDEVWEWQLNRIRNIFKFK